MSVTTAFIVEDGATDLSDYPQVATLADGGFVVAWSDPAGVYVRFYDYAGRPVGGEILVASVVASYSPDVQVAVLEDGNLVVLWSRQTSDGFWVTDRLVEGVVITPRGEPVESFSVGVAGDGIFESGARLTAMTGGGFAISYFYDVLDASNTDEDVITGESGIRARVFDAAGNTVGQLLTVPYSGAATIAGLAEDYFVLVYRSGSGALMAQVYSAAGYEIGGRVTLASDVWSEFDVVGLEGSGYVVTWATDGMEPDVWARVVGIGGPDVPFQVNTTTIVGRQSAPSVSPTDDGGFVIAWVQGGLAPAGLFAERFLLNGQSVGGEFQLAAGGGVDGISVTALSGSGFVAVWDVNGLNDIRASLQLPSSAYLVLTEPGQDVTIGGYVNVIGTAGGGEVVRVTGGSIGLDGSFNRGGDTVVLPGTAGSYFATRTGSYVIIGNGVESVAIPVGTAGLTVQFSDSARTLLYDVASGEVRLGGQAITTGTPIDPANGTPFVPAQDSASNNPSVLVLSENGQDFEIGGRVRVVGTLGGGEVFTVDHGVITFDASFNAGGDTVILPGASGEYTATRSGSFVTITDGQGTSVSIPVGLAGLTVQFDDLAAVLRFDPSSGNVMLGDSVVSMAGSRVAAAAPSLPAFDDVGIKAPESSASLPESYHGMELQMELRVGDSFTFA